MSLNELVTKAIERCLESPNHHQVDVRHRHDHVITVMVPSGDKVSTADASRETVWQSLSTTTH